MTNRVLRLFNSILSVDYTHSDMLAKPIRQLLSWCGCYQLSSRIKALADIPTQSVLVLTPCCLKTSLLHSFRYAGQTHGTVAELVPLLPAEQPSEGSGPTCLHKVY